MTEIEETVDDALAEFKNEHWRVLKDLEILHKSQGGYLTVGEIKQVLVHYGVSGHLHIKLIKLSNCCDV